MNKLYFENIDEWEKWLAKNHAAETELWLIYYKKHTKKRSIPYNDSVKVALCYGWIDSLVKRIDEDCYARKFNPRKDKSVWSESNKKRIAELLKTGKMQKAGLAKVEAAKQNGNWEKIICPPAIEKGISADFQIELNKNPKAKIYFESLTKSQQNQFNIWVNMAKRTKTKQKRIKESITLLNNNKRLGLK